MRNLIVATVSASAMVLMAGSAAFAGDASTSVTPAQPQGYYYGPKTVAPENVKPDPAPSSPESTLPTRPGFSGSSGYTGTATGASSASPTSTSVYPMTPAQQNEYKAESPDESGGGMDHTRESLPNTAGTQ